MAGPGGGGGNPAPLRGEILELEALRRCIIQGLDSLGRGRILVVLDLDPRALDLPRWYAHPEIVFTYLLLYEPGYQWGLKPSWILP